MNVEAVNVLIEKNPKLAGAREKLQEMQPGRYCIHRSWGFGRIKEYREEDNRLIIDFDSKEGDHEMDPAFCVNTMEILPQNHLLVRKRTEPEVIDEMAAKRPVELVMQALDNYPNHAATGQDLEHLFRMVLGDARFRKWWNSTKRHLAKSPHINVPARKTECYFVREEPLDAQQEVIEEFLGTQSAQRRIKLAERLLSEFEIKDEWREHYADVFSQLCTTVAESNQLTVSQRLHGAWIRDDLAKVMAVSDPMSPAPADLIKDARDLETIADELPTSLQRRLLDLVKESSPGEWKETLFSLLKDSQGKFTTETINFLMENDCEEELAATLARWLTEQNLRAPVLHWIVKNRGSRKFAKVLDGLISPRLLNAIFFAIDYESLQSAGTRKIPLADILSDDPDLIPDLLANADAETARDLANNLLMNQGFEELTKKSLLARFIRKFPAIQNLVAGEAEVREERLLVSEPSYQRRKEEYETIVSRKIPEIAKAIGVAREHGDLRENSEYKMAKQEQALLLSKKEILEAELARAQVTDFSDAKIDQIGIGSVAGLRVGSTNQQVAYTLLGAWDSDPERNILSYETPLAKNLIGKKVGDQVTLNIDGNEETWIVEKISRFVDESK